MKRKWKRQADTQQTSFDFGRLLLCSPPLKPRRTLQVGDVSKSVPQWADDVGLSPQTIYSRLKLGYTPEAAVSRFRASTKVSTATDVPPGQPGSMSWDSLEWEEDPWAQQAVLDGPMTLKAVGECFGFSVNGTENVEREALAKVRMALELEEILGVERGTVQWTRLRGEPLEAYERAVRRARKLVEWEQEQRSKRVRTGARES